MQHHILCPQSINIGLLDWIISSNLEVGQRILKGVHAWNVTQTLYPSSICRKTNNMSFGSVLGYDSASELYICHKIVWLIKPFSRIRLIFKRTQKAFDIRKIYIDAWAMLKLQAPSKLNISPNTRYPMTAIQRSYVSKVSWNRKKFESIFMWRSFEWKIWLLFHLK